MGSCSEGEMSSWQETQTLASCPLPVLSWRHQEHVSKPESGLTFSHALNSLPAQECLTPLIPLLWRPPILPTGLPWVTHSLVIAQSPQAPDTHWDGWRAFGGVLLCSITL